MYDGKTIQEIVEATAAETGEAFFDELVRRLARAMNMKCAWVTEWLETEQRLRALSFWIGDRYFGDFEYAIAGTPCAPVIEKREFFMVPDRIIDLYPLDPDLEAVGAVSYMGIPLFDTDQRILGHLAVLHNEPLIADPTHEGIFRIFASRAAGELRRLRRDRDLREREEKLSRLVNSAMDGIVELDVNLHITQINAAAEKLFCRTAPEQIGRPFADYVTSAAHGTLIYLTQELDRETSGKQSLWIRDGLEARREDGSTFHAEATLSRCVMEGTPYYTLILRDIEARLAAEAQIRSLRDEAAYLRDELEAVQGFDEILGRSSALRAVLVDVEKVADSEATVLITGETGTGKELIARAIHRRSNRAEGPLIKVNCAAIPASLQESEFFGHEQGAFTGATQRRPGRFKLADGGTIFLDEVGELPLDLQAKLLRVLQEGEYEPVGSSETETVNVRVIAATHCDLDAMVKAGTFRSDLLYRLNVFPLHLPALRDREDDVIILAGALLKSIARRNGRTPAQLTEIDKAHLRRYSWPGNVRELQNVLERAVITAHKDNRLSLDRALPAFEASHAMPCATLSTPATEILTMGEMRSLERTNLIRALREAKGKISGVGGAAERLGVNPNTLSSRMKSLGIQRDEIMKIHTSS